MLLSPKIAMQVLDRWFINNLTGSRDPTSTFSSYIPLKESCSSASELLQLYEFIKCSCASIKWRSDYLNVIYSNKMSP